MRKSTMELLELLKASPTISDFIEKTADELIETIPLYQYLDMMIEEKKLKKSEVIKRSGLDRGYVYDIFAGKKIPSRDKVLAICFAMELSEEEVQRLLKYTGYPQLYARIERESIILFALQHQLKITDVNELLYEMNYEYLY